MGVRVDTNGYYPERESRRRGVEISDNLILDNIKDAPIVFCKWVINNKDIVIGFAALNKFNGNEYLRKYLMTIPLTHEYASMNIYQELPKGVRIRRVESTDCELWYSPTNRMDWDRPIFFYYELSKLEDKCYRFFRWAKPRDRAYKKTDTLVSMSDLKHKMAFKC